MRLRNGDTPAPFMEDYQGDSGKLEKGSRAFDLVK